MKVHHSLADAYLKAGLRRQIPVTWSFGDPDRSMMSLMGTMSGTTLMVMSCCKFQSQYRHGCSLTNEALNMFFSHKSVLQESIPISVIFATAHFWVLLI